MTEPKIELQTSGKHSYHKANCIYIYIYSKFKNSSLYSWGYRICWRHHCKGVSPSSQCIWHKTTSNGEAPVWRMSSTPSLPLLPGSLGPVVVEPLSGLKKKYLIILKQMNDIKLNNSVTWWYLGLFIGGKICE